MVPEIGVIVNGQGRRLPTGATLADLLAGLELPRERVAVEHNLEIVPRRRFDVVVLEEGDRLEIVHFVGGG